MNIYDMKPGKTYLVGDSLGYDLVRCIEQKFDKEIKHNVVVVEYVATGSKDVFFETTDCMSSAHVEER